VYDLYCLQIIVLKPEEKHILYMDVICIYAVPFDCNTIPRNFYIINFCFCLVALIWEHCELCVRVRLVDQSGLWRE
jgi:hypothetical protein